MFKFNNYYLIFIQNMEIDGQVLIKLKKKLFPIVSKIKKYYINL